MSPWLVWMVELSLVKRSSRISFISWMPNRIFSSSYFAIFYRSLIV
jgi:hypothetical protein